VVVKPTNMVGGYAQLAYGFNYYGTVGCQRDEVVVLHKIEDRDVDWLERPLTAGTEREASRARPTRHSGIGKRWHADRDDKDSRLRGNDVGAIEFNRQGSEVTGLMRLGTRFPRALAVNTYRRS
jgi:hypothetical protein